MNRSAKGGPLSDRSSARVLVEAEDKAAAFARLRILETAGYQVAWCPGPESHLFRQCPLARSRQCPLVDSADVVVTCLEIGRPSTRQILTAMGRAHPELPVVVETTAETAEQWAQVVGRHRVVVAPATSRHLVAAVSEALRSRASEPPQPRPDVPGSVQPS